MQIKEIFKTAMEKTKSVLKRLLGFLNAKRFSIVTLLLSLILCLNLYSCLVPYKAREPTTASASNITTSETDTVIVVPSARLNINRNGNIVDFCECSTLFIPYLRNSTTFDTVYHLSFNSENNGGEYYPVSLKSIDGTFMTVMGDYSSNWYASSSFSYQILFVRDSVSGGFDFNANTLISNTSLFIEVFNNGLEFIDTPTTVLFSSTDNGYVLSNNVISISSGYNMLRWVFYKANTYLFSLSLSTLKSNNAFITDNYYTRYITISPELIGNTQYYYDLGYNEGYYRGQFVGSNGYTPIKFLSDCISDFFDIRLFGEVSIATILYISLGIVALILLVKAFT